MKWLNAKNSNDRNSYKQEPVKFEDLITKIKNKTWDEEDCKEES